MIWHVWCLPDVLNALPIDITWCIILTDALLLCKTTEGMGGPLACIIYISGYTRLNLYSQALLGPLD